METRNSGIIQENLSNAPELDATTATTATTTTTVPSIENDDWVQVISGLNFYYALHNSGNVAAWGKNPYGKLGLGKENKDKKYKQPEWIKDLQDVKKIFTSEAPYALTFFLLNNGTVLACGHHFQGDTGYRTKEEYFTPTPIQGLTNIINIIPSPFGTSTFFIDSEGKVFCFGGNDKGQLGIGNTDNQSLPIQVKIQEKVKEVICDQGTTYFLTTDNTVYGCGDNSKGQLGLGDNLGDNNDPSIPTRIKGLDNVSQVKTFHRKAFFITHNGELFVCGDNLKIVRVNGLTEYQRDNRHTLQRVSINFAVKEIHEDRFKVGKTFLLKDSNNQVYGITDVFADEPTVVSIPELSNLKKIVNTMNSSFYLLSDGNAFVRGHNSWGHMGLNKALTPAERGRGVTMSSEPIPLTSIHKHNLYSSLDNLPPFKDISSNDRRTYFLTENGKIFWSGKGSQDENFIYRYYQPFEHPILSQIGKLGPSMMLARVSDSSSTLFGAATIATTTTAVDFKANNKY